MKNIKINILAILMTFAAMPAWGIDAENNNLELIRLPIDQRDITAEEIFRDSLSGSASDALYQKRTTTHILQDNKQTVGFITYNDLFERRTLIRHIAHLAVAQNKRGKGFARFMINEIEKQARQDNIAVIEIPYEEEALKCYERLGYIEDPMHPCTVMKRL